MEIREGELSVEYFVEGQILIGSHERHLSEYEFEHYAPESPPV
jgi:hypothetical protein